MRKRTKYTASAVVGAASFLALAESNWLLALIVGAGIGIAIAVAVHAYPNDIAPPADRRHENTQRRKGVRV